MVPIAPAALISGLIKLKIIFLKYDETLFRRKYFELNASDPHDTTTGNRVIYNSVR